MKDEKTNSMKVSSNPAKVPCCTVKYDACSTKTSRQVLYVSDKELNSELYNITFFILCMNGRHQRVDSADIFSLAASQSVITYVISPVRHVSALLNLPIFRWIRHKQQEKGWWPSSASPDECWCILCCRTLLWAQTDMTFTQHVTIEIGKKCRSFSVIWIKHTYIWASRGNRGEYFRCLLRSHRCSLADDCRHTVCGTWQHLSTWMQRFFGESSWQLHYGTGLRFPGMVHSHRTPERWRQMPAQCHPDWTCSAEGKCTFLMNGAWLSLFSPYAAVPGRRLPTQLICVSTRGLVVFSPQIFSVICYNKPYY